MGKYGNGYCLLLTRRSRRIEIKPKRVEQIIIDQSKKLNK